MKLSCAIMGWIALAFMAHGDSPPLPVYPMGNSFTPFTDTSGYVNPIIDVGNIDFGQALSLPLVLNFSSKIRPPSPEFGQGWECPLFEAKIVDVQQNEKKVELLGGRVIYLVYNQRAESWKHFYSNHWTGRAQGDDFELAYDNIWKFDFHEGLISSMTTPGGRTILWNRAGGKLLSMGEAGKSPAMTVIYDQLGFAKQILLHPDNLGVAKNTYDFSTSLIYAGVDKIRCFNGRQITVDRSRDRLLNPVLNLTDTMGLGALLTWDKKTGKILSDGNFSYQIMEVNPDKTFPKISRTSYVTHQTESFYFDEKHGMADAVLPDGTIRHIEMNVAPGPNYKEIRLVQETKNGRTHDVVRRAFDDQGHLLLEVIGLANNKAEVKQYTYDNAGRVVSYLLNGKEMWKNVYDPASGQLRERDLPGLGVRLAFEELPGGQVKESILRAGGLAASTQVMEAEDWQAKAAFLEAIH